MADFVKLEDVVLELSADLNERGFRVINPCDQESVRYSKPEDPYSISCGVEEINKNEEGNEEEPDFNHIYLIINYNVPEGTGKMTGSLLFPNRESMDLFFQDSIILHHSNCVCENPLIDNKMTQIYHIGFEKDETTSEQMRDVLRETISYFQEYVTTNLRMLERTKDLR
ncbi:hypothetical protein GOV12_03710 [Candidatus Pacearchaeota archaeon]|nr:hypothetical protein [Candidatus Pacearchaeota archaeon]